MPVSADGAKCHSAQSWGFLRYILTPQSVGHKAGNQSSVGAELGPDFLMLMSPQAMCSVSAAELGPRFVGGPEIPSHHKEAHTYLPTKVVTAQLVLWLLQGCGGSKGPIKIFVWDP